MDAFLNQLGPPLFEVVIYTHEAGFVSVIIMCNRLNFMRCEYMFIIIIKTIMIRLQNTILLRFNFFNNPRPCVVTDSI